MWGILVELFLAFLQIGAVSFGGGYASLPVIQDIIVSNRAWLSQIEMTDVITISQLTPGPIAINAATFVGTKVAGFPGAVVASVAVVIPQTLLMLFLGYLLFKGTKVRSLDKMLQALRPGVVGLIAAASLDIILNAILPTANYSGWISFDWIAVAGFAIGIFLTIKKMDIIKLIGIGALVGLGLGAVEYYLI